MEEKKEEKKSDTVTKKEGKIEEKDKDSNYKILQTQIDELKKQLDEIKKNKANLDAVSLGKTIFINNPGALKTWNMRLIKSFSIDEAHATSLVIDHENNLLVVGTNVGVLRTYNLKNWEQVDEFQAKGSVNQVIYLNDSKTIISIDDKGAVLKYDLQSKSTSEIVTLSSPASSAAYILDGTTVYISCGAQLHAFNIDSNKEIPEKGGNFGNSQINRIVYVKEEKLLALGFEDGSVKLWDISANQIHHEFADHKSKFTDLTVLKFKGDTAIASTAEDKLIHIYNVPEKSLAKSLKIASSRTSHHASRILYAYDEKTLFTIHDDGKIVLNNFNTGDLDKEQTTKYSSSSSEKITSALYSGDGTHFYVGTIDGKIEIYAN
jgi:WD40 repeat protein